ncbi:MAG: winged helix-turn-helix transcriptional regulator [Candidatus Aenigmarchaeota archaeon]|nr:winged helix-turn-helix transcriptional regulator [Candidatus Aenigmarchaeota archaeon]
MRKPLLLAFLLIAAAFPAMAEDYYADVQIKVWHAGEVEISGTTNHPTLAPGVYQNFTSKSGSMWVLNITLPETFSEYVYDVELPQKSQVNYLSVPKNIRMETRDGALHLIGSGMDQKFFVVVQYSYDGTPPPQPPSPVVPLAIFALVIAGIVVHYRFKIKKIKLVPPKIRKGYNPLALTERQKEILDFIEKAGNATTQAKLQAGTNIPKASLSRNIDALVKKGILKRERKGMTMVVYFSEE